MKITNLYLSIVLMLFGSALTGQTYIREYDISLAGSQLRDNTDLKQINTSQVLSLQFAINGLNDVTTVYKIQVNNGNIVQALSYSASSGYQDLKGVKIFYINGTYLIIGHVLDQVKYANKLFALKVSASSGFINWSSVYDLEVNNAWSFEVRDACLDNNGAIYILADAYVDANYKDADIFIYKISSTSGNSIWCNQYSIPSLLEVGSEIKFASNGNILLSGFSTPSSSQSLKGLYIEIAPSGAIELAKRVELISNNYSPKIYRYKIDEAGGNLFHAIQAAISNNVAGPILLVKSDILWNTLATQKIASGKLQLESADLRGSKYLISGLAPIVSGNNGFVNTLFDNHLNFKASANYPNVTAVSVVAHSESIWLSTGEAFMSAQPYQNNTDLFIIKTNNMLRTNCDDNLYPLASDPVSLRLSDLTFEVQFLKVTKQNLKTVLGTAITTTTLVCEPIFVPECPHTTDLYQPPTLLSREKASSNTSDNFYNTLAGASHVEMFHINGQKLLELKEGEEIRLEINRFPRGIYIFKIVDLYGQISILKHAIQ